MILGPGLWDPGSSPVPGDLSLGGGLTSSQPGFHTCEVRVV